MRVIGSRLYIWLVGPLVFTNQSLSLNKLFPITHLTSQKTAHHGLRFTTRP
jgi:hypothetical protein